MTHPLVASVNSAVLPIITTANGAFILIHMAVYTIGLNWFNTSNVNYVIMFFLELIPNFYVLAVSIIEYAAPTDRNEV